MKLFRCRYHRCFCRFPLCCLFCQLQFVTTPGRILDSRWMLVLLFSLRTSSAAYLVCIGKECSILTYCYCMWYVEQVCELCILWKSFLHHLTINGRKRDVKMNFSKVERIGIPNENVKRVFMSSSQHLVRKCANKEEQELTFHSMAGIVIHIICFLTKSCRGDKKKTFNKLLSAQLTTA